ncbi:hypothetical protein M407DRAFT_226083 [Tulasnella calospora MUT 4182]|uniref:Uncharacterized protein n=1 Tax=Tulasnella calospora MUT 4182 TaxID=1051891 RepID=A0A0C3QQP8_9AGAM|nr:hypothetical protein M407DRAFT_226083 [Tulasnella calospora MUT 4182]
MNAEQFSSSIDLFCLPPDSERVLDADEEIFLIYTRLAGDGSSSSEPLGLGFVDSKSSEMTVSFNIEPPIPGLPEMTTSPARKSPGRDRKKQARARKSEPVFLSYVLEQDPSSLRSRKGDTGNVLWRASVRLCQLLLTEHHFPPAQPLLRRVSLETARVLELGAGIGLLACALGPLTGHYTVTDIEVLVPLLRKNVSRSALSPSRVTVTDFDWVALQNAPKSRRSTVFGVDGHGPFDLILCCDCIYNTELVPPLVEAINYAAPGSGTVVLVVAELREEDVLREFLSTWLESGSWEIWRLPERHLGVRTIAWAGWRKSSD